MTIPSRPAPAPPGAANNGQSPAVAGANATLEQIRLQLQQQQQMQQQHGNGMQRITIKLPPPPKAPMPAASTLSTTSSTSSITRKFPPARYSPATNWDESPFDAFGPSTNVAAAPRVKKPPPPRPPPPRLAGGTAGRKGSGTAPPTPSTRPQPSSIIGSLFQRNKHKQQTKTGTTTSSSASSAARVYNVSSGNYGSTNSINSGSYKSTTTTTTTKQSANVEWNAAWNTTSSVTTTAATATARANTPSSTMAAATSNGGEPQLISFDSPPSSPTFTQKSNSDCLSVDSFSSDSNFSSPNNGSVSQPESGFEDDFSGNGGGNGLQRSRPTTTSPLDPWETPESGYESTYGKTTSSTIGTAPVRNIPAYALRTQQTQLHANANLSGQSTDNPLCNGKSLLPPPTSLQMPTIIKPKISQKPKAPAPKPPVLHAKPNLMAATGGNIYGTNLPTPPSPPMPMGAPPPPPAGGAVGISLLDVISGKVDAIHLSSGSTGYVEEEEKPYGIALYDFNGVEEGDLNFRENEKIYLIEQVSDEWYRGRTRSGCEGIFPVNYIDIRVPLQGAAASAASGTVSSYSQEWQTTTEYSTQTYRNSSTSTTTLTPSTLPNVRCLYNFPAEVAGDLALKENDYVSIHYRINEDWLYGESNGRLGQFPANFLEYIPDNIPYSPQ